MECLSTGNGNFYQFYFPYQGFTSLSILYNAKSRIFDDAASASLYLCTNSTSFFSSTVTSNCKSFLYYFKQFS